MSRVHADIVLDHIRTLVGGTADVGPTDAQLLTAFVAGNEESAFALLVRRHGPLVWGVCRRVLRDPYDADAASRRGRGRGREGNVRRRGVLIPRALGAVGLRDGLAEALEVFVGQQDVEHLVARNAADLSAARVAEDDEVAGLAVLQIDGRDVALLDVHDWPSPGRNGLLGLEV